MICSSQKKTTISQQLELLIMPLLLNLESSTGVCSVAISSDGKVIGSRENNEGLNHAKLLTVFVEELFKELGISAHDLDAVAVSSGPGSYTGLRIGVSAAKGICYASGKPLISISPLQSMALHVASLPEIEDHSALFCPMTDARRMEVYTTLYDYENKSIMPVVAKVIDDESFYEQLEAGTVYFFGNGSEKCKEHLNHANARFIKNIDASALYMFSLAEKEFEAKHFVDVAYYEPFYLKNFVAAKPTKNVFK